MAAKKPGVNSELKRAVNALIKDAEKDDTNKEKFERRCKAVDRGLKLAAIEAKMNLDEGYGQGFGEE